MNYLYCVAENTGKGFITADDSRNFFKQGYNANIWVIEDNVYGQAWITRKQAILKTNADAQAIVDADTLSKQNTWDADNVEGETAEQKILRIGKRPTGDTLQ
jgi:hypothetical protein